jgi:ankyrin repeat protein
MKPIAILSAFTLAAASAAETSEPPLRALLRDGLYAEEVANDPATATRHYEQVLARFEEQRPLAANALFRLAELYRKTGRNDEAVALYQRVLAQFPDATPQAALATTRLAAMGAQAPTAPQGTAPVPVPPPADDEETKEIRRLSELAKTSPDLFNPRKEIDRFARNGWLRATRVLVEHLEDDERQRLLSRALLCGAEGGQLAFCHALLDQGVNPNQPADGQILGRATWQNRTEVVKLLLQKGAKPNLMAASCRELDWSSRDDYQPIGAALHVAAVKGNETLIRLLLDAGADASLAAPGTGNTPMHLLFDSPARNSVETLKRLLAKGAKADVPKAIKPKSDPEENERMRQRSTPLHKAIFNCDLEIVRCLLASGVKPAGANDLAVSSADKIRLLLEHGADPKLPYDSYRSLLQYAASQDGNEEVFWLLFHHGAPIDERWKAEGFPMKNQPLRRALLEQMLFPEWSTQDTIRLVAFDPSDDPERFIRVFPDSTPPKSFPTLADKHRDQRLPSLAELLLKLPKENSATMFQRSWITSVGECVLYRKKAGGGFEQIPVRFDSPDPFPAPQWGDILWFDSSKRGTTGLQNGDSWPESTRWNLRRQVNLHIEMELGGRKQPLTLRGDRFSYDPTQPVFPWSAGLNADTLVRTLGMYPAGETPSFQIRRPGWPQPIQLTLGSAEARKFELAEGDRIVLPSVSADDTEAKKARLAEVRLRSPGLWFGLGADASEYSTPPTLLQMIALAYQGDKDLSPFVSPPDLPKIADALGRRNLVTSILPHPDLARLRIRRLNADGSEKAIAVDLQQAAAACRESTSREEARKFDVELQAGDIVELPMIESQKGKPWPGFSDAETRLFGLALSCRVQFTDGSSRELRDVQFAPPKIIETPHGRLSVPQGEGFTSLEASGLLDQPSSHKARNTISLTRNGEETEKRLDAILMRDGDQIDLSNRSRPIRPIRNRAAPAPPAPPAPPALPAQQ